ncbi:MAG: hypothetical protein EZS28_005739 [Streblomastix strix]|uniref:Uncharacterized protein n=1 Tax=Streblomastix strix TaxID=222440 RepID=A0A5J4WW60_9EUKA|nr:MAG: hypothetical protein EZS28_005739 [Streblomastix strix]
MDTDNLKLTQKVGKPKKYFTEQEAQEMTKKYRGEAKKRYRLNYLDYGISKSFVIYQASTLLSIRQFGSNPP